MVSICALRKPSAIKNLNVYCKSDLKNLHDDQNVKCRMDAQFSEFNKQTSSNLKQNSFHLLDLKFSQP
jgi:hypothetical protein